MQDCVGVGVKSAIIISAGFKETGHEGAVLENEIMEIARGGNIRVIGPNCLGVMVRSSLVLFFICFFVAKAHLFIFDTWTHNVRIQSMASTQPLLQTFPSLATSPLSANRVLWYVMKSYRRLMKWLVPLIMFARLPISFSPSALRSLTGVSKQMSDSQHSSVLAV